MGFVFFWLCRYVSVLDGKFKSRPWVWISSGNPAVVLRHKMDHTDADAMVNSLDFISVSVLAFQPLSLSCGIPNRLALTL